MRFGGSMVGLVVGFVLGRAVVQVLLAYWPWSGPDVNRAALLWVFVLVVLGSMVAGWVIAARWMRSTGQDGRLSPARRRPPPA